MLTYVYTCRHTYHLYTYIYIQGTAALASPVAGLMMMMSRRALTSAITFASCSINFNR